MTGSPYREAAVAEGYARVAVPLQFAAPARDLVAAAGLRAGQRVLDVGTGTGAAAAAAARVVGPAGQIIGIDPSLEMLRQFQAHGAPRAAARAGALPFAAESFDAVLASFVLSHLEDVPWALGQMIAVLRPRGVFGATTWGARAAPVSEVWSEAVSLFTNPGELQSSFRAIIPGDGWFSDPAHLHAALTAAGLRRVEVCRREYRATLTAASYASLKEAGIEGALLRRRLGEPAWQEFRRALAERFERRLGPSVTYTRDVHIATGRRSADARNEDARNA